MKTIIVLSVLLACAAPRLSAAGPAKKHSPSKPAAVKPAPAARVAAGGVKAASVAMADFAERLRGERHEDDLRPWIKALAVVENYTVAISREASAWVVAFTPDLQDLQERRAVKGGAVYRVEPSSYRIIDRSFPK